MRIMQTDSLGKSSSNMILVNCNSNPSHETPNIMQRHRLDLEQFNHKLRAHNLFIKATLY